DVGNAKTTDLIIEQIRTAFLEDVAVFEAQQRNLLLMPDPPQTDINADAGVIQARRILDPLHQEEQAAAKMAAAGEDCDACRVGKIACRTVDARAKALRRSPVGAGDKFCPRGQTDQRAFAHPTGLRPFYAR